ncbi:DUF4270 family protein [Flagellimonas aurea]|uniref:DUF4270 family protein n=1 Tax=Flagellimonas aurea TaxID=2915619 RepID=UPI0035D04BD8
MTRALAIIGLMALLLSCSNENLNTSDFLAGEAFTDSNLRVVLLDTISVATSTIKFDSIVTSESSRILVGTYLDPVFGRVTSSSYFGLSPSAFTIDREAEYDSIVLHLTYDDYYYNDTLATNTLRVKRVLDNIRPDEGDFLYNTSEMSFEEGNLGLMSYRPRPMDSDTLLVRLDDDLGEDLFVRFQENEINSLDQFRDYFKGIALLPGEQDNGSVIGFSKTSGASFMRLYFTTSEENERVQSYLDLNLDQTTTPVPFYNQIVATEPIAPLQGLVNEELELDSESSNNQSYIQSGIGMATKIRFPYIKNIYDIQGQGTVLDAVLKIKPVNGSFDQNLILRDSLSVYVVDQNNELTSQLLIGGATPVRAMLNTENEEFNEIHYEISLGSYIEKLLTSERDTEEGLILLPNNYNSTVDRFMLYGMDSSKNSVVLELTYAIYDEEDN